MPARAGLRNRSARRRRGLRFAGFAALGALAVATGVVYLAAAAGISAVDDLADALVPFDNLYLGIALDGATRLRCPPPQQPPRPARDAIRTPMKALAQ